MGLFDIFKEKTKTDNNKEFPFDDVPNTATFTCCHVMEDKEPILYASHDEDDGMWQFLCGRQHSEADARIVSLYSVYDWDKSVGDVANMPCGCCAERKNKEAEWVVRKRIADL